VKELEDEVVESRLRAYGPVGPPEALRAAVLRPSPRPVVRRWLAVAALLLVALVFRWSAGLEATPDGVPPVSPILAPGGGADALGETLRRAMEREARMEAPGSWETPSSWMEPAR
jgi:hypothetical protein